ncbi:MAG TPA: hypothetical protein VKA84_01430 [Gemmatimonadaceae bacterium]|nr:hypothetical protein [Gemmatimonadaceae bacterium]
MPPDPSSNLPSRRTLDRASLERVLARAAELQMGPASESDDLTEEQLIDLGKEVGLSAEHLRQALAEERTRVVLPEEHGFAADFAGPARAAAMRTVRGTPADVLLLLDTWMQREECLRVRRRQSDRISWEPRNDVTANIKRGLGLGGRAYDLARIDEVSATVTPLDQATVHVRLDADLVAARAGRMRVGGVLAGLGLAAGGVLGASAVVVAHAALIAALPLAALPVLVAGGVGYGVARRHRQIVARAQLALEQVLDKLEHGEIKRPPPSVQDVLNAVMRPR